ncbi:MAG: hypothetical protein JNK82_18015 [Myxococcaceae bacterium]|nr:hypothetical protein [Myxococcaceae bacterium]
MPSIESWVRQVAPPGTGYPKLEAAAMGLKALETTTGFKAENISQALAPLGLDAAALKAAVARFKDTFEALVRPDATANFFDPREQVKQAAWHAGIKQAAVDPVSGQPLTPKSVAEGAKPPSPAAIPLSAAELNELLELGPSYTDGNSVQLNPTAKKLAVLLEAKAREALAAPSFEQRNLISSQVIAQESAVLAAAAAGVKDPATLGALYQLFFESAFEAGNAFRPAFNADGTKSTSPDADGLRGAAQSAAGGVAFRALPKLMELLGVKADAAQVIRGAAIEDVASVASGDLKLSYFPSAAKIAETLKAVVAPDDYFFSHLDKLANRGAEQKVLGFAVRLANTTWKAGQVHRAAWEGTDRRINPKAGDRLAVFNPYDNLKADMYNATFSAELTRGEGEGLSRQAALGRAGERSFARVVFEIYKDLVELKKAAA